MSVTRNLRSACHQSAKKASKATRFLAPVAHSEVVATNTVIAATNRSLCPFHRDSLGQVPRAHISWHQPVPFQILHPAHRSPSRRTPRSKVTVHLSPRVPGSDPHRTNRIPNLNAASPVHVRLRDHHATMFEGRVGSHALYLDVHTPSWLSSPGDAACLPIRGALDMVYIDVTMGTSRQGACGQAVRFLLTWEARHCTSEPIIQLQL